MAQWVQVIAWHLLFATGSVATIAYLRRKDIRPKLAIPGTGCIVAAVFHAVVYLLEGEAGWYWIPVSITLAFDFILGSLWATIYVLFKRRA